MITRFVEVLHNIGFEPTAEEIADMLWLASHLAPQAGEAAPATSITQNDYQHRATSTQRTTGQDENPPPFQPESPDSPLYLPAEQKNAITGSGFGGLPFRSLAASALPGALAFGRALRPLMRRVPSRTRFVFDEEATIQRIADEGYWLPVLRPAHARWLKVALIVDEWPSMVIWRQTIAELQRLLERHGAFRNVQTWGFTTEAENGRVRLRAGTGSEAQQSWTRSPRELIDPSGQQLILVVSDCVSPGWFNGEVTQVLAQWGQNGLVTIVQMLPERLWPRSALGNAASVHLRARVPGPPNARIEIEWPWYWLNDKSPAGLPVPVVTLEPRSLASWAQFVAGMGGVWIPGVILPTAPSDAPLLFDQEAVSEPESSFASPSPVERLQMFQATVSPLARRLAGYLAATPLSLPVMRLVQRVMLPESRQVHLAEVFLSELLTRQTPDIPAIHPDDVQYDFVDGVRELLLSTILVSDAMEVLTHVSNFITRQTGSSFNFRALIADPTATERVVIDEGNRPFASVTARVLHRLGGQYAQLASRLEQWFGGVQLPSADVAIFAPGQTNASGKQTYDIFLSYRTTHTDWVETLAHNLKAQGYSIFLDRWELIPGQHFPGTIYQALRNSRCAILVASPEASDSGWVQEELQLMITLQNSGSGFFYVPIVIGEFPDLPFLETVQAVDFGDSSPDLYRRAFQRLLCGLQQKPPGPDPMFQGELILPNIDTGTRRPLVQSEHTFLDAVFNRSETSRPLMILAQADINTQIYGRALRRQAETLYGVDNVFHIFPPNSSRADSAAYFGRLAKQCHLEGDISESWHWAEALSQKLDSGREVFLLVTGFENGPAESRRELAGELRQLNERYPALRLVMMGGEGLAAIKYASGSLSLLNIAEELPIPQLTHLDLHDLFGQQYPQLNLSPEQLQSVLDFTGCHPRLLSYCLQHGADSAQACAQVLRQSPLPTQLFTGFHAETDRLLLCTLLAQTTLGRFDIWSDNELLRRLYWANLITRQGQHFVWHCEFIRQTGREILECG